MKSNRTHISYLISCMIPFVFIFTFLNGIKIYKRLYSLKKKRIPNKKKKVLDFKVVVRTRIRKQEKGHIFIWINVQVLTNIDYDFLDYLNIIKLVTKLDQVEIIVEETLKPQDYKRTDRERYKLEKLQKKR